MWEWGFGVFAKEVFMVGEDFFLIKVGFQCQWVLFKTKIGRF